MTNISPDYYAQSVLNSGFWISGSGLNNIPNDAVGLYASSNESPLAFRDATNVRFLYRIASKTDNSVYLESYDPTLTHAANYLGAIVSADRQTIYWVNDSQPIP